MKAVDAETMAPARRAGWAQGVLAAAQTARLLLTLGAVLLAAVALRLWGLGDKSLWFDEAYSVYIARQALGEIPRLLRVYDPHPPLYYVLLRLWMGVAGQSEVAVRVPSVVASLAAIGLTYLLGRRLAGEGVGLLAAGLLAASPFQVTAAQEARMYPFLMLFGVGASYALWLALAEGRRRYWMGYVLCLVLALYTHHFAVLLLLAHGGYVLGVYRAGLAEFPSPVWPARHYRHVRHVQLWGRALRHGDLFPAGIASPRGPGSDSPAVCAAPLCWSRGTGGIPAAGLHPHLLAPARGPRRPGLVPLEYVL